MISAKTQLFAVLGHPIGHSLSPAMHNAAFDALKMDALYLAFDVPPKRLMGTLEVMAELGFRGVNLTVPLKEEAFKGITHLSKSAKALGSVNTVRVVSGELEGHSTDGEGFLKGVDEAFGLSVKGISVFVIGCGGAGRAVAIASAMAGAGRINLTDIDMTRAEKLKGEITALSSTQAGTVPFDEESWIRAGREADLVVHATPVGMHENEDPVLTAGAFRRGQCVYDLIYNFSETGIMKEARKAGARASNGLGMLLFQGALAFSYWLETPAPVEVMGRALEKAVVLKAVR